MVYIQAAVDPVRRVPVTGYASELELVVAPSPIAFGSVPVDYRPLKQFTLKNAGGYVVTIGSMTYSSLPDPVFRFYGPAFSGDLASGCSHESTVEFAPVHARTHFDELEIAVVGVPEPVRVPTTGNALNLPCGDYCLPPVAQCPGSQATLANRAVTLVGAGIQAMADPVTCRWSVLDRPLGSSAAPAMPAGCTTAFVPDLVGSYMLELLVSSHMGGTDRCQVQVKAEAHPGLWVEMYWSLAGDVDLRLLHPNHTYPVFIPYDVYDCNSGNRSPDWDAPGPAGDPFLDRDDQGGTGPENIRIDQPTIDAPYAVAFSPYRAHNTPSPSTVVTTNVYCAGTRIAHEALRLGTSDFVVVGKVSVGAAGGCSWVPLELRLEPE